MQMLLSGKSWFPVKRIVHAGFSILSMILFVIAPLFIFAGPSVFLSMGKTVELARNTGLALLVFAFVIRLVLRRMVSADIKKTIGIRVGPRLARNAK